MFLPFAPGIAMTTNAPPPTGDPGVESLQIAYYNKPDCHDHSLISIVYVTKITKIDENRACADAFVGGQKQSFLFGCGTDSYFTSA